MAMRNHAKKRQNNERRGNKIFSFYHLEMTNAWYNLNLRILKGEGFWVKKYIAHIREDGAKQTCAEHCINTASIASSLLSSVGLSKTGYLSGLLHDMGKFHDKFLEYIQTVSSGKEYKGPKVIHTFAGVSYILKKYHGAEDKDAYNKITSEIIALAIGSHHGLFDIYHEADDYNAFVHRIEKQPLYDKEAVENFFHECVQEQEVEELFKKSKTEICELYSRIVDYIKRTEKEKQKISTELFFYLSLISRLILSAVIEGDRRDTAAFMLNVSNPIVTTCDWNKELNHFNSYLTNFSEETEIQRARTKFSQECCNFAKEEGAVYRLNLPTGGGKTLSSMRYALNHASIYGKRRIFYVAPLLTILEQNAMVIKEAIGEEGEVLLHYSNVAEDESKNDELDKTELLQESWSSKIIITTLVQMLQTMFSGKMSSVRRFNALSNSIIIFDEIQSLPMKTYSMFNLAINFLSKFCKATVILCSATLPSFESVNYKMDISSKLMISPEIINETKQIFKRTDIKEWKEDLKLEDVPAVVLSQVDKSSNVLVVCNTKREASYVFNEIRNKTSIKLFHLSAGMCPKHRRDMLRELTKSLQNNEKLICVSTQVIEAGIDISFSCVFRFAAGIDSVVQSAGRCNRNGIDSIPHEVYILKVCDEILSGLKEIQQSKDSIFNLLAQFDERPEAFDNDLASLSSIAYYYKILFSGLNIDTQDYPNPIDVNRPSLLSYLSDNQHFNRDGITRKDWGQYFYCQCFDTAGGLFTVFDNFQQSVVVPYNEEAKEVIAALQTDSVRYDCGLQNSLLKKAKDYSVSIFNFTYDTLNKSGAILQIESLGVSCLRDEFYDGFTGVSTKEVNECSTLMI